MGDEKSMRGQRQQNSSYVYSASLFAFGPSCVSRPNTAWHGSRCAGRMINHLAGVFTLLIGFVACLRGCACIGETDANEIPFTPRYSLTVSPADGGP